MQKLVIKRQFMGVKPCEIELNRFLLLIGEQASGKSTIAKLIFFFETLPDLIYDTTVKAYSKSAPLDYQKSIYSIIQNGFLETFGLVAQNENFHLEFYFQKTTFLKIFQGQNTPMYAYFEGETLQNQLISACKYYVEAERLDAKIDEITLRQQFKNKLDVIFNRVNAEHTYFIAGRNTIVAFPEIFETVVGKELEKLLEDEIKEQDFEKRQRLGNERLLYEFVEWSKGVRTFFKNNGQSFERVAKNLTHQNALFSIQKITNTILKGTYESVQSGEQIKLNDSNLPIPLKDASSGQQEVLRLLQGIFLSIGLQNRKEFFVVEEPEAHLYPLAQKELIHAFAVFLNTIQEGKMIVTTHSPYILACINILLFANYVSNEIGQHNFNGSISTIPRAFWLDASIFNAYSLGQNGDYCVDIKDPVTGLIDQNYLDAISEQLGLQQQELYNLLTEKML